jgi:tripartite-type tricarboxylate transporter receptor subunit TctC
MQRRTFLLAAACAAASPKARAAGYPDHLIRIIVPFSPGGATDALARGVAQQLSEAWGQAVVVENRPGANGNIGTEMVGRSPPDGYTLLLTINSYAVNPSLYPNLGYDQVKDFQPLTLVATSPNVLVARPGFPARTVKELIEYAKHSKKPVTYASAGTGSGSHLAGVLFSSMAGVPLTHIPYKGVTPAIVDVIGGQVDICFSVVAVVYPHIQSGKLQAIALTGLERAPLLPDLPTVAESGLPGYDVVSWFGLLMPAHPDPAVLEKLQSQLNTILRSPSLKKIFAQQGLELKGGSPRQFADFLASDQKLWAKVIKDNNIRLD